MLNEGKRLVQNALADLKLVPSITHVVIEYWVHMIDLSKLDPPPTDKKRVKENSIGKGGTSIVYHGNYNGESVAVKLPRHIKIDDVIVETAAEQIEKECNVMAKLEHPSLCRLYGMHLATACLVMERGELGNLKKILKNTIKYPQISWTRRLLIATDICKGLVYLHAHRIYHRDLKSLNILLRSNWSAMLCDFGISRIKLTANSEGTAQIGTAYWRAPEMNEAQGIPSELMGAIDIYSFGMILYELCTRMYPFEIEKLKPNQVIIAVNRGQRPLIKISHKFMKGDPIGYISLMKQCWHQNPRQRPDAKSVLERLEFMLKEIKPPKLEKADGKWNRFNNALFWSKKQANEVWKRMPHRRWSQGEFCPTGLVSHPQEQQLYLCGYDISVHPPLNSILSVTCKLVELKEESPAINRPTAIDIDIKNETFYIMDETHLRKFTFRKEERKKWLLPDSSIFSYERSMKLDSHDMELDNRKLDNRVIYMTKDHQIYCFKEKEGGSFESFNIVKGKNEGEFDSPLGLTVDGPYLEICDSNNHRIQILDKQSRQYITQWGSGKESIKEGEFMSPQTIYLWVEQNGEDGIVYIGDRISVQLFTRKGEFIQRLGGKERCKDLGQFWDVRSICVCDEQLYVCDNNRIQVFSYRLQ